MGDVFLNDIINLSLLINLRKRVGEFWRLKGSSV